MEINKEKPWFNFKNMGSGKVVLEIFGVIGWDVWLQSFSSKLKDLDEEVTEIEVLIASEGGYLTDGIAIYNMLKIHKAKIITNIISHAWSIASIIALAGDVRKMASNATYMIHNPWNIAWGEAEDLRKQADILDGMKETLINSYKEVSTLSREEISNMMNDETWMLADEAKSYGFVTEITGVSEQAAAYVSGDENSIIKNSKAKFSALNKKKPEGKQTMKNGNNPTQAAPQNNGTETQVENTPAAAPQASTPAPALNVQVIEEAADTIKTSNFNTDTAVAIVNICNQVGKPEKAADFIKKGMTEAQAKATLFDQMALDSGNKGINDSTNMDTEDEGAALVKNMASRFPK